MPEGELLFGTAVAISLIHTVSGPDHYLPFIALSKARNWSLATTLGWTIVCGIGHIVSSLLLGVIGITMGWTLSATNWLAYVRGGLAGWAMFCIGLVYLGYALVQLHRRKSHRHFDIYDDGVFVYEHKHQAISLPLQRTNVTPWVMFIIFVLGPCEPLLPLLFYPAAQHSWFSIALLICVFTICSLVAMVSMVVLGYFGYSLLNTNRLEKYVHIIAAITVLMCGTGLLWLNW